MLVGSALAVLPLSLLVTLPFAGALRQRGGVSRQAGAGATSTVEEGLMNMLAVQSQGGEARELARFDRDSWESFSSYRSLVRTVLLTIAIGIGPMLLLYGNVFFYSVDLVIAGTVSVGDFSLVLTYFAILAGSASEIGSLWFRVQGSAAGLHRVFHLMDLPGEREVEGSQCLGAVHEGVRLERVSFAYDEATPTILDVDLAVTVGKMTALVGPAGAGKTTLAYLLAGFLQPTAGRVCVDGRDLREFTQASVRSQLGFVFQETALFDETIEANLRLAKPHASESELRRALRLAGAEDFVSRLPQGLETPLGRGGGKLSVGQKQRLSIARALLRGAPVLVLDEPTSALDPEAERHLVQTLSGLRHERAVLVIAHRLSTIRSADEICFMQAGRIAERGSHDELMALPFGAYRRFVELQTRSAV
jgi:ABC-type multidrug transport system fused ATPase/permease subunit